MMRVSSTPPIGKVASTASDVTGTLLQKAVLYPQTKQLYQEVNLRAAVFTVTISTVVSSALLVVLLILSQPQPARHTQTLYLRASDDMQDASSRCTSFEEVTAYGDSGIGLGLVPTFGEIFIRRYFKRDELLAMIEQSYCTSAVQPGQQATYQNVGGVPTRSEFGNHICFPQKFAGSSTSPMYIISDSLDLAQLGEKMVVTSQSSYTAYTTLAMQSNANASRNAPHLIGAMIAVNNPNTTTGRGSVMPPLGAHLTAQLAFWWPLQPQLGAISSMITILCDVNATTYLDALSAPARQQTLSHGMCVGWSATTSSCFSSVRVLVTYNGALVIVRHDLLFYSCMVEILLRGYSRIAACNVPGGPRLDQLVYDGQNGNLTKQFVTGFIMEPLKMNAFSLCPGRVQPVRNTTALLMQSLDRYASNPIFQYRCEKEEYAGVLAHVSHIWPVVSLIYTIVMMFLTKFVYKVVVQIFPGPKQSLKRDRKSVTCSEKEVSERIDFTSSGSLRDCKCIEDQFVLKEKLHALDQTVRDLQLQFTAQPVPADVDSRPQQLVTVIEHKGDVPPGEGQPPDPSKLSHDLHGSSGEHLQLAANGQAALNFDETFNSFNIKLTYVSDQVEHLQLALNERATPNSDEMLNPFKVKLASVSSQVDELQANGVAVMEQLNALRFELEGLGRDVKTQISDLSYICNQIHDHLVEVPKEVPE